MLLANQGGTALWGLLSVAVHGCESLSAAFSSADPPALVWQYMKEIQWKIQRFGQ